MFDELRGSRWYRLRREHGSVVVVQPTAPLANNWRDRMRRVIGIDIHRTFAEVVFWQDGRLRWHGRVDMTRAGLRQRDGGGPCAALQLARRRRRRPESHGSACSMHPKRRVCGRFATSRTWPSELERRYGAPGPKSEVEQRIEGEDVDGVSDQSQLRLASSRPQVLSVRWRRTLKPRRITAPAASACDGSRPQMVLQRQPPHTGPRRGIVQAATPRRPGIRA